MKRQESKSCYWNKMAGYSLIRVISYLFSAADHQHRGLIGHTSLAIKVSVVAIRHGQTVHP